GAEDTPTRSVPQRDTQFVETMVRTALDGATTDEFSIVAIAQRWVVGVVSRLDHGVDSAPWVRMIVAQEALRSVHQPREGRDQEMARFFLSQLHEQWGDRRDLLARATLELAPIAVRLSQLYSPADEEGLVLAEAVQA